jgi:hypothetical protein
MSASTLRWALFALIGLLVAASVAFVATRMVSAKIGISSEPVTAGESLSPQAQPKRKPESKGRDSAAPRTTTDGYQGGSNGSAASDSSGGDGARSEANAREPGAKREQPGSGADTGGGGDGVDHESDDD